MERTGGPQQKSRKPLLYLAFIFIVLLLALGAGGIRIFKNQHTGKQAAAAKSPVPAAIRNAANFTVYYPDQTKLPKGYTLDKQSFGSPQKGNILFFVSNGATKLIFSEQQKPNDDEIQDFYTNYIPLRNKASTPVGEAEIGAHNNKGTVQSVTSLPTLKDTWIIVTAPADIDQDILVRILKSLTY